ncbi:MAG: hypothetical protein AAB336_05340 [Acidobacteriota bacterium]
MQINWENDVAEKSPILLKREACWDEFCVKQVRVLAGEMPEHTAKVNEINLTMDGKIKTQRHTSSGKTRVDCGDSNTMCFTPIGQTIEAKWDAEYETVMIDFSPKYLTTMALEMNLPGQIVLRENLSAKDELIQHLSLAFISEVEKEESSRLFADSLAHTLMFHIIKNYTNAVSHTKQFLGGLSGRKLRLVKEFFNDNCSSACNYS